MSTEGDDLIARLDALIDQREADLARARADDVADKADVAAATAARDAALAERDAARADDLADDATIARLQARIAELEGTTPPVGVLVASNVTTSSFTVTADFDLASIGRDGTDATGHGPWINAAPTGRTQDFTRLLPSIPYMVTAKGTDGRTITLAVSTAAGPVEPPSPPDGRAFLPTTMGGSVSDAANGQFNAWAGQRLGMYGTWGDNGTIFAINAPGSEYGADSLARLGDYDLDVAPQHYRTGFPGWAAIAGGAADAGLRATFEAVRARWAARNGHVFIRPFHEFNGNWYPWSVRTIADQTNFVKAWRERIWPIFLDVFKGDARFHLVWSPNRDSSALDVRSSWPGRQYVHAIGVDYYDFAKPRTEAEWAAEEFRTQAGSPVGIGSWQRFAAEQGVPWYLPEWGVQFGDNPLFAAKVLGYVSRFRYISGDPTGRCLGAVWHNLKNVGSSPATKGDFLVQAAGKDYTGRPNTARTVREWLAANKTTLRSAG